MTWKGWEDFNPLTREEANEAIRVNGAKKLVPAKKNKFNANKKQADGFLHDSGHEAERLLMLMAREAAGEITELRRQVEFELTVLPRNEAATQRGFIRVGRLIVDFTYRENGVLIVEDAKSKPTKTPLYRWKKRHIEIEHCINIREV